MFKDVLDWLYTFFRSCFRFNIFGGNSARGDQSYAQLDDDEVSSSSDNVYHETRRLLRLLENQYGTNHPSFYTSGDFASATQRAKRDYKLMLVYLHSEDHQDSPEFCRNVLCTEGFKEYVDANFVFFGADISTRGGYALSNRLGATTYPFFAVIYVQQSQVNVVSRLEGSAVLDLDSLLVRLIDVHENSSPQLVAQQYEDSERENTRRQLEEQDRAYKEAEEKDRRIAEERRKKESEALRAQQEKERREREKLQRIENIKKNKIIMRQSIQPEPQASSSSDLRKQGISLVKFKLPDGSQIQRRFHKDDLVLRLYEFVHVLDQSMNSSWTASDKSDVTDYELSLNFPKRILDPHKTLQESDCFPNAQVFVREPEYDDDDEEDGIVEVNN